MISMQFTKYQHYEKHYSFVFTQNLNYSLSEIEIKYKYEKLWTPIVLNK